MDSGFEDGYIITLQDEDGNDLEVEMIDSIDYNGGTYYACVPTDASLEDGSPLLIMKVEAEGEEEDILVPLDEGEDDYNELFQIFCERYDDRYDAEEDEADEDDEDSWD